MKFHKTIEKQPTTTIKPYSIKLSIIHTNSSGGVGSPAGLALAGAPFDGVMNINIELLIGATGPPHFTRHYALLRMYEIRGSDRNGSS